MFTHKYFLTAFYSLSVVLVIMYRGTVSKLTSSFPPPIPAYIIANAMAWLESSVIYTERKLQSIQKFPSTQY